MSFKWKRPANVPFPSVWHTFMARDCGDCDKLVKYSIQDLPVEKYDEAVEQMTKYFIVNEPMCESKDMINDKTSIKESQDLWRSVLAQKIVIGCFKEGSDDLVGLNMVGIILKEEKDNVDHFTGKAIGDIITAMHALSTEFDVCEHYNVSEYMYAFGLSVDPKYRQRGIATEILRGRINLGKAIGVRLTSTVFTTPASQVPAKKVGFEENLSYTYKELAKKGEQYTFPNIKSPDVKLMSMLLY